MKWRIVSAIGWLVFGCYEREHARFSREHASCPCGGGAS